MNFAGRRSLRRTLYMCDAHYNYYNIIAYTFATYAAKGRVSFDQISFRKFRFTSRGCPFFWKFGNSRKFLFHMAFLPRMNQSEFFYSWKATRWRRVFRVNTALAAKWSAIVQAYSWSPILLENVRIWFPGKLWTGRSEFPVGHFARFAYSPARKVRKFLS